MTLKRLGWSHSFDPRHPLRPGIDPFERIEKEIRAGLHAIGRGDETLEIVQTADADVVTRRWKTRWLEISPDDESKFLEACEEARVS
jgi:hypothetical protein